MENSSQTMILNGRWLRFLSTTLLLFFGVLFTVVTISTNLFLAWSLPFETGPSWMETGHVTKNLGAANDESRHADGMVHIVTSRFMQLQPHLIALGKARLELFETFCLPSMINQQVDNFVWFIMADPNLEPSIMNRLKQLVSQYPHFFLVVMNNKVVTPDILTSMVDDKLFLTGDLNFLRSVMLDTNRPLLLETRLDADDALSTKTIKKLQDTARQLPPDQSGWQVICNDIHYEWRNDDIFETNITTHSSGQLRLVMDSVCVTVGYTLVRHRPRGSIDFPPWPEIGHHLISREWPQCSQDNNVTYNCWTRLPKYPAALRSRTVTSAGMSRVVAAEEDRVYDNYTDKLWGYVERDFNIAPDHARAASLYLKANLAAILEDNLKGQWYVLLFLWQHDDCQHLVIVSLLVAKMPDISCQTIILQHRRAQLQGE
jgi:Putative rhamnosyl transferase